MNSDFKELLKLFNVRKVRYLVVGGHAMMKYTEPRCTKDLDVWVEAAPKNARKVLSALREFGAPLAGLAEADFAKEGSFYQMGRPPARVDILMSIEGVHFADAWPRRVATDFDGVAAHVIARQLDCEQTGGGPAPGSGRSEQLGRVGTGSGQAPAGVGVEEEEEPGTKT
jgi:hypothetical protein